jgi:hypothetical protein
MKVARSASEKKTNPELIFPTSSVYMVSEGSMGDTVLPVMNHWTMWRIISTCTPIKTPARQREALECFTFGPAAGAEASTVRGTEMRDATSVD